MPQAGVVDGLLDVAQAVTEGDGEWPVHLVQMLTGRVGADTVGFADLTRGFDDAYSVNTGGPTLSRDERTMWAECWQQYPFFRGLLRGSRGTAVRTTGVIESMAQFRRTRVYAEHFGPRQAAFQANFAYRADGYLAMVGLYRSGQDFTDEDVTALEAGRQAVEAAIRYRRVVEPLRRTYAAATAVSRSALTAREQDVLALVADGETNAQIARRLGITERTVRKHVGDIHRRLGVTNRVAAARWWLAASPGLGGPLTGTRAQ